MSAELIDGYTLNVTRHDAGSGFTIQVVELPGCIAVSPTTEGIRHAIEVAIAVHLDALKPLTRTSPHPLTRSNIVGRHDNETP